MANILGNLFGGTKSSQTAVPTADADFADFAQPPEPEPEALPFTPLPGGATLAGSPAPTGRPYTKWYNVHERYSLSDFQAEGFIILAASLMLILHLFGARRNRAKARAWIKATGPMLQDEFAVVGYGGAPTMNSQADPSSWLREKSLFEFATYATGRQNTAFIDARVTLVKRFNPLSLLTEYGFSFFLDSFAAPTDVADVMLYPFDGREATVVPGPPGSAELRAKDARSSTYDGFVWAIVNKDAMKKLRDDRYDLSITFTKDHPKLPIWLSVMSESAEITDALLTSDLIAACEKAGSLLEYLIISDQPTTKPKTLDETQPIKRIALSYRLPSNDDYSRLQPLFAYFLRLPDIMVQQAHWRPEVQKKIRGIREDTKAAIRKIDETEKAEERALERDRAKKAKRDAELNALDAKGQKKYLEKEQQREMKKGMKGRTMRA